MPIHDFKSQRLFLDHPLREEGSVDLDRGQANYLISVLRMKTGDRLLVFNGIDGEWQAELETTGRKAGKLLVREQRRAQYPASDLVLCFAPLRQARLDYMVEKAVEMGAGCLQPVITQYTQTGKVNTERMRTHAIEAAEQCGILNLPKIPEAITLQALLQGWEPDRVLIFADEAAREANPLSTLSALKGQKLGVLIGPEGGFSEEERSRLMANPATIAINLGPRILRADTAAVAALAVVQAACGDW